ncbi:MAG: hypothetical protein A2808_03050 [Candidatus Moranbacteria bacterium RIFCSPHIGHO2_01_FULL_55_24]|nr:MAG: hypothetical protein A2808_03050 [Candidatus Moranbacteria bacterium RIFCSPHIGHO2_01_FULL_55_24]
MNKKKPGELKILRTFYPESEYSLINSSENPDFILKDNSSNILFGVEVTQYFDTPTSGRFKNIPNYVGRLLSKNFIHKEDIGNLKVIDTIFKIEDDGTETPLSAGVLRSLPQSPERIEALKRLVASKNSKYSQYDKTLESIDLLIYDSGDLVAGIDKQKSEILAYLRKQEESNTLKSPFRKIILVIEESKYKLIKIVLKSSN